MGSFIEKDPQLSGGIWNICPEQMEMLAFAFVFSWSKD